ncbi:putative ribonuclease H-like domain-containing protein [Tanacetum coccineum]
MQEELLQFKLQKVWTLVDLPNGKRAIGTKWVFRNKKEERGIVVRNKARLVAQGYTQEEGIDYDEVFAPVARIEAIRLFLAYASFMGFIMYQMDMKSAFLYGTIEKEVYVCQPLGFEDPHFPDKVYKVEKALYGLHQAPRAWYETLSTYLIENGFRRGNIDKTLFIKKDKGDILLVQKEDGIFISQDKYVAEILKKFDFATVKTASTPIETNKALVKDEEAEAVDVHLYRSIIGSLMYLTASRPDIMFAVCACARFQVTPKMSHLHAVKRIFRYLKGQPKLGLWYLRDSLFNLEAFSNSDYAGASLDRKSTTRDETVYKEWEDRMERAATTASSLDAEVKDQQSQLIHSLGSDEGSLTLNELTVLCTQLSTKVASLEEDFKQTKKVYGNAYTMLILKVKKLEKTVKTSQARRRAKIVVSDDKEDEEDSSKQGRSLIKDMDLDAGISLVPLHVAEQGRFNDTHVSDQPEEQLGVFSAAKVLANAARIRRGVENVHTYSGRRTVSTGNGGVSTANGLVSTSGMAQEVEINIPSPVVTKDRGKAVMQESEPPKKIKKRVQIQMSIDEELAQKLHEEEQARFNAEQEAKFNEEQEQEQERLDYKADGFTGAKWDDISARVVADEDLVQQLQAGEKYSEEDLPRKLVELVNQRKKLFAQQRAKAKRNKPMTPAQQKSYMLTYIKNQEGGYSIKKLKSLSFEQVKEIFKTTMRKVQSFVPMDSELEDKRLKKAGQEGLEEPAKRQKIGEASGSVQEQSDKEPKADELSQEQLQ